MKEKQPQLVSVPFFEEEEKIDFRKYFSIYRSYWYVFALTAGIALIAAWFYHKLTNPQYAVSASLLVNESKGNNPLDGSSSGTSFNASDVFQGFDLFQGKQNLENQRQILKSWTIISDAVDKLHDEVSYYVVNWGHTSELYHKSPFVIKWNKGHPQLIGATFEFIVDDKGHTSELKVKGEKPAIYNYENKTVLQKPEEIDKTIPFSINKPASDSQFSFCIVPKNGEPIPSGTYRFSFHSHNGLVNGFRQNLNIETVNKDATLLKLSMLSPTPQKDIDFINQLMEVYQDQNLEKKNAMATRTIQFISSQLSSVSDSLAKSEQSRESFQSKNKLLDISYQSQQLLDQMVTLEEQKEQLTTQQAYYRYLLQYLKSNNSIEQIAAPSTMGVDDPMIVSLLQQLTSQTLSLKTLKTAVIDPNHPSVIQLRTQIGVTQKAVVENSRNILKQNNMALSDISKRLDNLKKATNQLPGIERNYVNIERKYRLNNDTYTFLLQKLSEAKIAKASNTPDNDIIDPAMPDSNQPVSPNKKMDYLLAFLLGVLLPAIAFSVWGLMDNKIRSEEEIEKLTNIPVLANVPHSPEGENKRTSVLDTPNSPVGEAYRALRQKLRYLIRGKDKFVIAITSTGPGEGKTFSSLSTAASFALMGRSTVVLDLDLRRSNLAGELHLPKGIGISSYLTGQHTREEIIFGSRHPKLKIIPSGDYPPNPGELLTEEKLGVLIERLQEQFDVVIIDSPPVLVADIFQYAQYVDGFIYVIRQGVTLRPALERAVSEIKKQQLKNVGILYNDVQHSRFGSGYGYGYGYGYGSYEQNTAKKRKGKPLNLLFTNRKQNKS